MYTKYPYTVNIYIGTTDIHIHQIFINSLHFTQIRGVNIFITYTILIHSSHKPQQTYIYNLLIGKQSKANILFVAFHLQ